MKILVCISNVPDTTTKVSFNNNNTEFNTNGVQFILNPYDEIALARAIELTEGGKGTVTVINVGLVDTEPTIRKALAIGADDAIRINAAPSDSYFVAKQLAEVAKAGGYDMIMCGRESIDYNGAQVPSMLAEVLDYPSISLIKKIEFTGNEAQIDREIEGGKEVITVSTPFVVSTAEGVAEPKIPNMRGIMSARTKPLQVVEPVAVEKLSSFTSFEMPTPRGNVKLISADEPAKLVEALNAEAKVI
ncbi:MAG: electron transfer flavoprotein subunit beta/FixA family protein [Sphingobacteriales bacterium]|nr:electron transfer flavoprotein subunit beta/FixA family protein [Sphingobacteriales bacterium]